MAKYTKLRIPGGLGTAKPSQVMATVSFSSDSGFNQVGTLQAAPAETAEYLLRTASGETVEAVVVNTEDIPLTAETGDIRAGKTAITEEGVVIGTFEGVDTSDATAAARDIVSGKTAYVGGEKLTGTFVALDTSDATATANDIVSGKTAYIDGEKVEGTFVGLDTSDATATAANIATGKTAYVNGELVTGTNAQAGYTKKTVSLSNGPSGVGVTVWAFASLKTTSSGSTASSITVGINDNFYLYAGATGGSTNHTWTVSVSYS